MQIDVQKMLHAARVEKHAGRENIHLTEDLRNPLDDHLLEIAPKNMVVGEFEHREPVHRPHFLRGQHDAAKAAAGTDEDLVTAGNQHGRVRDRPGAAGRG